MPDVSVQIRTMKDRRSAARVRAYLLCQFTFEGITHDAYMPNLSLNSAFLRSFFVPPMNSHVVITLRTPLLKNVLTLESEVVRTESATEYQIAGFAVVFSHISLDLIELIKNLISQPFRIRSKKSRDKKEIAADHQSQPSVFM